MYRFTIEVEVQTGEHGGSLIELAEPIVCAEYEMDEVCNNRFANYRQLMAHKTSKHGIRTVLWTADKNERMSVVQVTVC